MSGGMSLGGSGFRIVSRLLALQQNSGCYWAVFRSLKYRYPMLAASQCKVGLPFEKVASLHTSLLQESQHALTKTRAQALFHVQ